MQKFKRLPRPRVDYSRPMYEDYEQVLVFRWAKENENHRPELKAIFHIPNGGARDKITGAKLKAQGVKAGVPDICLPVARGGFHGLYVELKRVKGGQLTQNQKTWINRLNANGYKAEVCKGADEAIKTINAYLGLGEFCDDDLQKIAAVLGGICHG